MSWLRNGCAQVGLMALAVIGTNVAGGGAQNASRPPPGGGLQVERRYVGEAGARRYMVYLPTRHGEGGARALPLVVMLHGCTQDVSDFAAGTRMNVVADELGFVVAYPEQPAEAHPQKCWRWYEVAHQRRSKGEPSMIAGITDAVVREFGADPDRVSVAGVSAGGAMAFVLASTYPELYAAVGSHSGIGFGTATNGAEALAAMQGRSAQPAERWEAALRAMGSRARPIPAIVFHGAGDEVVRVASAHSLVEMWRATNHAAARGRAADAGAAGDMPNESRGTSAGGYTYTRTVFGNEPGGAKVERWIVAGLGHAWSGGSREGTFTDPAGPDASREIARFLLAQRRGKVSAAR